ncbi:unnamed protein product [Diplocarpon coronariae]
MHESAPSAIQDSPEDWRRESAPMNLVYHHACGNNPAASPTSTQGRLRAADYRSSKVAIRTQDQDINFTALE